VHQWSIRWFDAPVHRKSFESSSIRGILACFDDLEAEIAIELDGAGVRLQHPQDGPIAIPRACPCFDAIDERASDTLPSEPMIDPHAEHEQRRGWAPTTLDDTDRLVLGRGEEPATTITLSRLPRGLTPGVIGATADLAHGLTERIGRVSEAAHTQLAQQRAVPGIDAADGDAIREVIHAATLPAGHAWDQSGSTANHSWLPRAGSRAPATVRPNLGPSRTRCYITPIIGSVAGSAERQFGLVRPTMAGRIAGRCRPSALGVGRCVDLDLRRASVAAGRNVDIEAQHLGDHAEILQSAERLIYRERSVNDVVHRHRVSGSDR